VVQAAGEQRELPGAGPHRPLRNRSLWPLSFICGPHPTAHRTASAGDPACIFPSVNGFDSCVQKSDIGSFIA
jgi:hypothetical protein